MTRQVDVPNAQVEHRPDSPVDLLSRMLADLQSRTALSLAGNERLALTEMFRSLDMCAFAFRMAPNRDDLVMRDRARHWMLAGAAFAVKPLLHTVSTCEGPMPWGPSAAKWTAAIDEYLVQCGQLAWVHRLASLERYGLSRVTVKASNMRIEVAPGELEAADREALTWLIARKLDDAGVQGDIGLAKGQLKRLRRRLDKKSGTDMGGWFIRYSGDEDLLERSRRRVRELEPWWSESEALPDAAVIGGRTFREWKNACCAAAAAVLHHLEFATRLRATHPDVDLRNLLTMFLRRDDAAEIWEEREVDPGSVGAILQAMMLDHASVSVSLDHHDTPFPFYVDLGREFVLAPSMSGLLNPFVGVVRHLRSHYRSDWDRAVDSREPAFRADVARLFKPPRFDVLPAGAALRRPDRTLLTDVDAIIVDRMTGTIGLVQLKWHDIFANSLRERESRKRNLLAANEWVERVSAWIGGRSSAQIADALGASTPLGRQPAAPVILVVARYAARFSGPANYDSRSGWLSWPELVRSLESASRDSDVLRDIAATSAGTDRSGGRANRPSETLTSLRFPGLEVEVVGTIAAEQE
jgi:hypothetical protein